MRSNEEETISSLPCGLLLVMDGGFPTVLLHQLLPLAGGDAAEELFGSWRRTPHTVSNTVWAPSPSILNFHRR